jgi:CheY-like chemotaxis protein
MSRILLVDDSPHAQRMGERILSDEGYEVVTVSNADSALIRLDDVDPDVVLADAVMPGRSGYEICQYLKMSPRHSFVRVILTAGVLEEFDEARARRVEADGTVRKPFEASALLSAVKPLAEAAAKGRDAAAPGATAAAPARAIAEVPFVAVVDAEHVQAAVTVALDASMQMMVDQITRRVLAALRTANTEPHFAESGVPQPVRESLAAVFGAPRPVRESPAVVSSALGPVRESPAAVPSVPSPVGESPAAVSSAPSPVRESPAAVSGAPSQVRESLAAVFSAPAPIHESPAAASSAPQPPPPEPQPSETPRPAVPSPPNKPIDAARRVTPLRIRPGSILGLDIGEPEPPTPDPE